MALFHSPSVVKRGLVLHLDAANIKSYPGSGTVWYDLSGRNNHGTLINGPVYNSSNNGAFTFDGSNDEVVSTNDASLQITVGTISVWFKAANGVNAGYNGLITKQLAWGLFVQSDILITYDWGSSVDRSTSINVGNNRWNYAAMTFTETVGSPTNNAIIYLNGIAVLTTTIKHSNHSVAVEIGEANSSQFFTGSISQASIYNRALSAAEVRQNFEALRGRYGI